MTSDCLPHQVIRFELALARAEAEARGVALEHSKAFGLAAVDTAHATGVHNGIQSLAAFERAWTGSPLSGQHDHIRQLERAALAKPWLDAYDDERRHLVSQISPPSSCQISRAIASSRELSPAPPAPPPPPPPPPMPPPPPAPVYKVAATLFTPNRASPPATAPSSTPLLDAAAARFLAARPRDPDARLLMHELTDTKARW